MGQIFEGVHRPRRLRYPDHTFTGATSLDVDGRTLALADLGPAHTSSDVVVHLPDAGVVFAGDLLFARSTPLLWHGPLANQTSALRAMLAMPADTYVPGHGPLAGPEEVRAAAAYWDWFGERAREQYERGRPPLAAGRALIADGDFGRWSGWMHPERLGISLHTVYREFAGRPPRLPTRRDRSAAFGDAGLLQRDLARRT
jgi:glyoxylase-like metal-dependent hydrolase (beta-lactamase superfamily II)